MDRGGSPATCTETGSPGSGAASTVDNYEFYSESSYHDVKNQTKKTQKNHTLCMICSLYTTTADCRTTNDPSAPEVSHMNIWTSYRILWFLRWAKSLAWFKLYNTWRGVLRGHRLWQRGLLKVQTHWLARTGSYHASSVVIRMFEIIGHIEFWSLIGHSLPVEVYSEITCQLGLYHALVNTLNFSALICFHNISNAIGSWLSLNV